MGHAAGRQPVKTTPTLTRTNVFARQRERASAVLDFLNVRRERHELAREKARKVAQERRAARLAAREARDLPASMRNYGHLSRTEWVHEHNDRPMRPYVNPVKDRSLRGRARVKARRLNRV
jgi:hypothetical protein